MPKGQVLENYLREKYGDDWTAESVHQANQGQPKVQSAAQPQPQQEEYVLPEPQQAIVDTFRQPETFVEERARAEQPRVRRTSFDDVVDQAQAVYRERAKAKEPEPQTRETEKQPRTEAEAPQETADSTPRWITEAQKYMEQAKAQGKAHKQARPGELGRQTMEALDAMSPSRPETGQTLPQARRQQQVRDAYRGSYLYEANTKSAEQLRQELADAREKARATRAIVEAAKEGRMPADELAQVQARMPEHEALLRQYENEASKAERALGLLESQSRYNYFVGRAQNDEAYRQQAEAGRVQFARDRAAEQTEADENLKNSGRLYWAGFGGADTGSGLGTMQYSIDAMRNGDAVPELAAIEQALNDFTDEQKEIFYYWYGRDQSVAADYLEETRQQNARERVQRLREWSGRNFGTAALGTAAAAGLNLLSGADYLSPLAEMTATGEAGAHQPDVTFSEMRDAMRGGVSERLNGLGTIGGKGLGDLYQLGTSMLDSAIAMSTGNTVPTFFLSSAASGYQEAKRRGVDDASALLYGTAQGLAECTFEELSVEKLLSQDLSKEFWKNVLRQAGVEASEELTTSLANNISDAVINGKQSEWQQNYQAALAQGFSAREAYNRANKEMLTGLFWDALGGALSGGLMTGGHYAVTAPARVNEAAADLNFENADMLVQPPNTAQTADAILRPNNEAGGRPLTAPTAQAAPVQEAGGPTPVPGTSAPTEQAAAAVQPAQVQQKAPADMQTPVTENAPQEAASELTEDAEAEDEDLDFESLAESDPGEEAMYNQRAAGMQTEEELTGPDNVPKPVLKEFADDVGAIYPVKGSARTEARKIINDFAGEVVKSGSISEEALDAAAKKLENLALYERQETENDRIFRQFRREQRGKKIFVDEQIRRELGDDWETVRRDARKAGVTLTTKRYVTDKLQSGQKVTREAEGVSDFSKDLMGPGSAYGSLFAKVNPTDQASFLRRLAEVLGEGKAAPISYVEHILSYGREMDAVHEGYRQQLTDAARNLLQNVARYEAYTKGRGGGVSREAGLALDDTGIERNRPGFSIYESVAQGEEAAKARPKEDNDLPEGKGRRQLVDNTLRNSPMLDGAYNQIEAELNSTDPDAAVYDVIKEKESLAEATERVEANPSGEIDKLTDRNREWTGSDMDTAMLLMGQAQQDGATELAIELAAEAARRGTVAGQMIQALAKWSRTPRGAAVKAVGEIEGDNTIPPDRKKATEQQIIDSAGKIEDAQNEIQKIKDDFENGVYGGEMMPGTRVVSPDGQVEIGDRPQSGEITPGEGISQNADVRENADGQLEQLLLPAKQKIIDEIRNLARTRKTVSTFTKEISRMTDWALSQCTADECADIATAQLAAAASDLTHRTTTAEKLSTILCLNQLSSIGTVSRNLGGNAAFNVFDATSENFGALWDMAMRKFTGKRTMTFDPGAVNKATWEGRKHGFANAYAQVALDVDTDNAETRLGQTKGRTFKMTGNLFERFMSTWEKASGIALNVSDEYFKGGTEASYLARTQKLVDRGLLTEDAAQRLAEKEKLERTFQQDSKLADISVKVKNAANVIGIGGSNFVRDDNGKIVRDANGKAVWMNRNRLDDAGYIRQLAEKSGLSEQAIKNQISQTRFGLGNFILNYPKIPGNLGTLVLETAPLTSTINTIAKTLKVMQAGQYADAETQYEAAKAFGRSVTGYGVTAAAYALAKAGVLLVSGVNPDEDKDRKAQQAANGLSGMQINLDGIQRLVKGEDPRLKKGDTLLSVDFLEPVSGLFTIGGMMAENDADFANLAKTTLEGSANSILDIPMMENLKDFFKNIDDKGIIGAGGEMLASSATSVIPAPVRNLAKASDPYYRETGGDNLAEKTWNSIRNAVPGLRQTLPVKTDFLGQEKTYKASDTMRWLNALVNPGNLSVYETNEVTEELEKQFQETGEGRYAKSGSQNMPKKIRVNGEDVALTREQQLDFKNTRGQTYFALVQQMKNDPAYKDATPEERNKLLEEAWTASSEAAKVAAGVGYETDNKLVGMMQDGLSLPEAYAVKQWGKDRKADEKDAGKMWAYKMGLTDAENWTGSKANGLQGNEISEELERVYSSAGDGKLPTGDIPDSFKVDGEEIELTDEQKEQFKSERATVYNGILEDLLASDRYKNADAEKQLAMLNEAYEAAGEAAKVNLELGYEPDRKSYKLIQSGLGVAEAVDAKQEHDRIDELKKPDGKKLDANTKAANFKAWVEKQGWDRSQKEAVLDAYGKYTTMMVSNTERFDKLTSYGISSDRASKLVTDLAKLLPQDGKEDVTELQRLELIGKQSGLTDEQRQKMAFLYAGNSKTTLDKFFDSGLDVSDYVEVKNAITKYGHETKSGWSWAKDELVNYLNNHTDYTGAQKYWIFKTLKSTTKDKNNPWIGYKGEAAEHAHPEATDDEEPETGGSESTEDRRQMTADEAWKWLQQNGG